MRKKRSKNSSTNWKTKQVDKEKKQKLSEDSKKQNKLRKKVSEVINVKKDEDKLPIPNKKSKEFDFN